MEEEGAEDPKTMDGWMDGWMESRNQRRVEQLLRVKYRTQSEVIFDVISLKDKAIDNDPESKLLL